MNNNKKELEMAKKVKEKKEVENTGNENEVEELQIPELEEEVEIVDNSKQVAYIGILLSIISLIGLLIFASIGDGKISELKSEIIVITEDIKKDKEDISFLDEKLAYLNEKFVKASEVVRNLVSVSTVNAEMITAVAEEVTNLDSRVEKVETRITTAQKGVNRLARAQLINLGYDQEEAWELANQISVNPTTDKWDKLFCSSKYNLKKVNDRIASLNSSKANMSVVNEEVKKLNDLLLKKHHLVLKLLKKHGTRSMKNKLK